MNFLDNLEAKADFSCALASVGLTVTDLQRSSEQIVLFGSRAASVERAGSDWDVLVVGDGRTRHTPVIDLVYVSPRELATPAWLGSELAGHVACWGSWLHGTSDWVAEARCGEIASEHKARRLVSRLAALERTWGLLSASYQREHLTLFRRDLQRHALLARGEAVPPSALLDETWQACVNPCAEVLVLGKQAGLHSVFLEVVAGAQRAQRAGDRR